MFGKTHDHAFSSYIFISAHSLFSLELFIECSFFEFLFGPNSLLGKEHSKQHAILIFRSVSKYPSVPSANRAWRILAQARSRIRGKKVLKGTSERLRSAQAKFTWWSEEKLFSKMRVLILAHCVLQDLRIKTDKFDCHPKRTGKFGHGKIR